MADERDRDRTTDERFGRRVHEGLNAGVSRNAHTSGEGRPAPREAAVPAGTPADGADRGAGGYGDDTGFAGGTHAAGAGERDTSDREAARRDDEEGEERGHTAYGGTPAVSRPGGVGHEAPSGMEEIEHDERERRERRER